MALSNLFGWTKKAQAPASACGAGEKPAACGTEGKPKEKPAVCGTACGTEGKPEEKPAACGTACGAGAK